MTRCPSVTDPRARAHALDLARTAGKLGATRIPAEAHALIPDPSDSTVVAILTALDEGRLVRMRQEDEGYVAAVAEEMLQLPESV